MYVSEEKQRFLNERYGNASASTRKLAQSTMEAISECEIEWGTDFSEQPAEVLQEAVNKIMGIRQQSMEHVLTILRDYVKWRKKFEPNTGDGIFEVTADTVGRFRKGCVSSPVHLQRILDDTFDAVTNNSSDLLYRGFLWLAFAGISAEESVFVKAGDVDLRAGLIRWQESTYPIYQQAAPVFDRLCKLEEFTDTKEYKRCKVRAVTRRAEGDELLRCKARGRKLEPLDSLRSTLRPSLARSLAEARGRNEMRSSDTKLNLNYDISYERVYLSGVCYRAYEGERSGVAPNFEEQAKLEMQRKKRKGKEYKTTKHNSERKAMLRIARDYAANYEVWKRAFAV